MTLPPLPYRVTEEMIDAYGETIHHLSLNRQHRHGDPVRLLDYAAIAATRTETGLTDAEIAARVGLDEVQVTFIRNLIERRRFRRDQYRKLFALGGGRRYREGRYVDPLAALKTRPENRRLYEALTFDKAQVQTWLESGWWSGETLLSRLGQYAGTRPGADALRLDGCTLTFAELSRRAARFAAGLIEQGLARSDVVALAVRDESDFILAALGVAAMGGVLLPLDPALKARHMAACLRDARARAIICADGLAEGLIAQRQALPHLAHVIVAGQMAEVATPADDAPAPLNTEPAAADPALLWPTSDGKLVVHSHQTLLAAARGLADGLGFEADEAIRPAAPLWDSPGFIGAMAAIYAGAILDLGGDQAVDVAIGPATALADAGARGARLLVATDTAADPASLEKIEAAARGATLVRLWSPAQAPAALFSRPADPLKRRLGTLGRPAPGVEARKGETGLELRGPQLCPGHVDNATANAAAFTQDGWLRTDLPVEEEQAAGFWWATQV